MSQDSREMRFGLWYDFRNPSQWHQSPDQLYAATLDQIAWGDNHRDGIAWYEALDPGVAHLLVGYQSQDAELRTSISPAR